MLRFFRIKCVQSSKFVQVRAHPGFTGFFSLNSHRTRSFILFFLQKNLNIKLWFVLKYRILKFKKGFNLHPSWYISKTIIIRVNLWNLIKKNVLKFFGIRNLGAFIHMSKSWKSRRKLVPVSDKLNDSKKMYR